jgi:hypothetical protein
MEMYQRYCLVTFQIVIAAMESPGTFHIPGLSIKVSGYTIKFGKP